MRLVWLPLAIATRRAQLAYIAQDNGPAAIEQGDRIELQVQDLLRYPLIGRLGRRSGTRELVISRTPFIVVYRIRDSRIEILRVLHGAQRWP